jgi:hypothetical protein
MHGGLRMTFTVLVEKSNVKIASSEYNVLDFRILLNALLDASSVEVNCIHLP